MFGAPQGVPAVFGAHTFLLLLPQNPWLKILMQKSLLLRVRYVDYPLYVACMYKVRDPRSSYLLL
jgi:hypothetical protein